MWVKSRYGKASHCENAGCLKKSITFQWAKRKGRPYGYNRESFVQLCTKCHANYDMTDERRLQMSVSCGNAKKTHCRRGHPFVIGNLLPVKKNQRRCRKCKILDDAKRRFGRRGIVGEEAIAEARRNYTHPMKGIRILKDKPCEYCLTVFSPVLSRVRFCSLSCVSKWRHNDFQPLHALREEDKV